MLIVLVDFRQQCDAAIRLSSGLLLHHTVACPRWNRCRWASERKSLGVMGKVSDRAEQRILPLLPTFASRFFRCVCVTVENRARFAVHLRVR